MANPSLPNRGRLAALATAAVLAAVGCADRKWVNPPADVVARPWVNLRPPTPDTYPDPDQTTAAGLDAAFGHNPNPTPRPAEAATRPLHVLALSAGGKYVAYSTGVLSGWTAAGTRPKFDVVTGVSGGALLAMYAFLGPEYDGRAENTFVTVRRRDLFLLRPVSGLMFRDALAKSEPLAEFIGRELTDDAVAEIAKAHGEGRRLFVATGNRTTYQPVIWDVGAVASGGRADAPDLVRKIFLASASHPGFTPPVEFDVTVNGVCYRELHGDGGNLVHAFVRTADGLPPGSNVYVVSAGKMNCDSVDERPGAIETASSAVSAALYALFRADLKNIYALCAVSRSRFHLVATPSDVEVKPGSMTFDLEEQRRLFDAGFRQGASGKGWRSTPPGTQPDETLTPRTGFEFLAPSAGGGAAVPVPVGVRK